MVKEHPMTDHSRSLVDSPTSGISLRR